VLVHNNCDWRRGLLGALDDAMRVRWGRGNKVALIGRGMDGVREQAERLRKLGYDVEIFDQVSREALKEWARISRGFKKGVRMTDDELMKTRMFKENMAWVQKLADQGYNVVDAGNPKGAVGSSIFYEMEKLFLFMDAVK